MTPHSLDLQSLATAYRQGLKPSDLFATLLDRASRDKHHTWISLLPAEKVLAMARSLDDENGSEIPESYTLAQALQVNAGGWVHGAIFAPAAQGKSPRAGGTGAFARGEAEAYGRSRLGSAVMPCVAVALGTGVWAAFVMGGLHLWLIGVMPLTPAV